MPIVYIPEQVNPFRFAEQRAKLQGVVRIEDLSRLCASLSKPEGAIEVEIDFGVDEQGIVFLQGHLDARVVLQCQRCMEYFNYEIIDTFVYGVASKAEEAASFPEKYESIVANDSLIDIRDVIEDELILSMPAVPMHQPHECKVTMPYKDAGWDREERNPFHILKNSSKHKSSEK